MFWRQINHKRRERRGQGCVFRSMIGKARGEKAVLGIKAWSQWRGTPRRCLQEKTPFWARGRVMPRPEQSAHRLPRTARRMAGWHLSGTGPRVAHFFFCKGPPSKYFWICGLFGPYYHDSSPLLQHKGNPRKFASRWLWLCSKKSLFMDAAIWTSYNFPMPENIIFSPPFKNVS